MGKAKTIGIVIGGIVAAFFITAIAVGLAIMSVSTTDLKPVSEYDGLTEEQISRVKIIKETCDTQAYLRSYGSDELLRLAQERCDEQKAMVINAYRNGTR